VAGLRSKINGTKETTEELVLFFAFSAFPFPFSTSRSTLSLMTADEFRAIALSFSDTEERSHMNHPDFRVGGKIFATLGPDLTWGMAKLTPAQQQEYLRMDNGFAPASGKWGDGGATLITLSDADEETVRDALNMAWQNTVAGK
jgi:hypothetical protein